MERVIIIAEAGDNHNGSEELAYKLIDAASEAGADFVKFQTFKSEAVISRFAQMADYQKINTGVTESQLDMVKKLELPFEAFVRLKKYAQKLRIGFLSTPFDFFSLEFLDSLELETIKVSSGDITNMPFLERLGRMGKKVILSTGMSDIEEVALALDILKRNGSGPVTLLHCNTEYPTPYEDVNLRAMVTLRDRFHVPVGYSDHTLGTEVPVAAVALGAAVVEKHFTLDRNMDGPDHKASLEPEELAQMVRSIRNIEKAMGSGIKKPSMSESKNISIARKSIVAACPIRKGEMLTEQNLSVKRPGNGISPVMWYEVLVSAAVRDFMEDELIEI
jgi:N,N'-diacetyllegionaminate synthase